MKRLIWVATAVLCAAPGRELTHTSHYENVLGTSLELRIGASSPRAAQRAEKAVLEEIERQARILSAYDPRSEFSRWSKTTGRPVRVSPELFEVLGQFDRWRQESGGAFSAAAETIGQVWKRAAAEQRLPSPEELSSAVALAGKAHWKLDAAARTAERLSDAPLALNSFAKSYIASHASEAALKSGGVSQVTVNLGGDLVVRGGTQDVAIADPLSDAENSAPIARLRVTDAAVATSGNYRRGVSIGGQWYSHIVDPRTGLPAGHVLSATVVAKDASDAGALATALSVVPLEEAPKLAAAAKGAEYMLIASNGMKVTSPGWNAYAEAAASPASAKAAVPAEGAGLWPPGYELLISLELSRIENQAYRRPFVAVWIEDGERMPVKTLALWYDKPRWLPDLKQWYRGERLRSLAEGNDLTATISSATRPPGKYTLKWDGNDQSGKPVKAGRYTICIEAAREHGTYQVMRQEVEFNGKPRQFQLPGNTEVAAAALDYRKAAR